MNTEEPGDWEAEGSVAGDPSAPQAFRLARERWEARLDARLEKLEQLVAGLPVASAERERAVAGALDSLTAQLNEFTGTLVDELRRNTATVLEGSIGELRAAASNAGPLEEVRATLSELSDRVATGSLTTQILDRTAVLADAITTLHGDLETLALSLRGMRGDIARAGEAASGDRLAAFAAERRVSAGVDGLGDVLAQVAAGLASLRAEVGGRPAPLDVEDLAPIAEAVAALVDRPPPATAEDVRAAIDGLAGGPAPVTAAELAPLVAELRALTARPEPATSEEIRAAVDFQLASRGDPVTVDDLRAALERANTGAELERLAAAVAALGDRPTTELDLTPILGAIAELRDRPAADLAPMHAALAELRDLPRPVTAEDLATAVADVGARSGAVATDAAQRVTSALTAVRAALAEDLRSILTTLAELRYRPATDLEPVLAALTELRERPASEPQVDLTPVLAALAELHDRPTPEPDLTPIVAALAAMQTGHDVDLIPVLAVLTELRDRPAPEPDLTPVLAALAELRDRPTPQPDLAPVLAALADRPPGATTDDLAAAVAQATEQSGAIAQDLTERVSAALNAIRTALAEDFRSFTAGLARLAERPDPATADDLAPVVAAIHELAALGAVDLEPVVSKVDELLERSAAAPSALEAVAATVEAARAELRELAARPVGVTPEDLRRAETALSEALGDVRSEVRDVGALRPEPHAATAATELAAQLDAVGRVLQDAIASLHRIEDGTVGSSPRRQRSRQAAMAAVGDLRAARRARADAGRDEPVDPDPPAVSG